MSGQCPRVVIRKRDGRRDNRLLDTFRLIHVRRTESLMSPKARALRGLGLLDAAWETKTGALRRNKGHGRGSDLPPIYVPVVMRVDRFIGRVCCARRRAPEPGATHARTAGLTPPASGGARRPGGAGRNPSAGRGSRIFTPASSNSSCR